MLGVYVINLDGSDARLRAIGTCLQGYGIDFVRVPAVDGRKMNLSSLPEYDAARAVRYMGRELVGGEIGCYLSHLKAARQFLETDQSHALVLEDDADPLTNPVELLAAFIPDLDSADPDWLLVNIGNDRLKHTTVVASHDQDATRRNLVAAHYFPMTTNAIVWSRRGARRFVDEHRKIFAPVDNYFRFWLTRVGHGYSIWPSPVSITGAETEIFAADGQARQTHGRAWYYGFAKRRRLLEDKLNAVIGRVRFRFQRRR